MDAELSPESVLITGANRGLGLEFVKQFITLPKPPKHLFAACRSPDSAEELANLAKQYPSVKLIKLDLSDVKTITYSKTEVETYVGSQGLNLIINNAGIASRSNIMDVTAEEMTNMFNVNAVGPLMVIKTYLPLLQQAAKHSTDFTINRSAVINTSTGVASITENDTGRGYPYRTSKAALNMITKNASIDLKTDGILVAAINPGYVQTGMGGPKATTTPTDSVKTLIGLMSTFQSVDYTGKFYNYSGRELLW